MNPDLNRHHGLEPAIAANDGTNARLPADQTIVRRSSNDAQSRFDIYRANHVRITSTLFGGGDWHWRLTGGSGAVIADCGGYRNEAACLAAVSALRLEAGLAAIFTETNPEHKAPDGRPCR